MRHISELGSYVSRFVRAQGHVTSYDMRSPNPSNIASTVSRGIVNDIYHVLVAKLRNYRV
ncbi:hypothetical protein A6I87_17920 [Prescottella equi]|nr:hypothetical protein A6I87_17920 [Prescottella equi]